MKYSLLVISMTALIWTTSCHRAHSDEGSFNEESVGETLQSGEIVITMEQFKESGMKVGSPSPMQFSNEISASGMIAASLTGRAKISTLIPGRIKHIHHEIGETVQAGAPLFTLESHEIISLQQDYAEVIHQLALLKADYERQKALSDEKVVAQKDFYKTKSEYLTMLARAEGMKARLGMIYIDPSDVENGTIVPSLTVRAPIRGTITRQELVMGQFIDPQETVMEVVDTYKLQLVLQVFEKDLAALLTGQKIHFYTPDQRDRIFEATLSHVGKSINPETKTVQCISNASSRRPGRFCEQFIC